MTKQNNSVHKRRTVRAIATVVLTLCIAAAAWLGYLCASELLERKAEVDYYANLAADVASTPPAASAVLEATSLGGQSAAPPSETAAPDATLPAIQPQPTVQDKPVELPAQSEMDFEALRVDCPDVVGWICIPGTRINYPVMQGENNQFYLSHLPNGSKNSAGSIMLDIASSADFTSTVSILHGHHMKNGTMFGDLDAYADETYYRAHPTIRLYTPYGDCTAEIFAACTVNGRTFGYPTNFASAAEFDAFVADLTAATAYETGVELHMGDRILLLSTCAYSFDMARYVVAARIPAASQR